MSGNDKLTSRHHWVSQFILRRFQIPGSNEEIYIYQRSVADGESNPGRDDIREVAQEIGGNTLTSKDQSVTTAGLEDIFSAYENSAAPVVAKLVAGAVKLSNKDRMHLAQYIGILAAANPKTRRLMGQGAENPAQLIEDMRSNREWHLERFVKANPTLADARGRMERYIDNLEAQIEEVKKDSKTTFALSSFHLGLDKAEELFNREWEVITTKDPNVFIIADHPVIAIPPGDDPKDWEDHYWDMNLVLPLSPTMALQLVKKDYSDDIKRFDVKPEGVELVNRYSMLLAEDHVFSHSSSDEIRNAFSKTQRGAADKLFVE